MRVLSVISLLLSTLMFVSLSSVARGQTTVQNVVGFATCNFTTMQLTRDGRSGVSQMSGWLSVNLTAGAYVQPNTPGFAGRTFLSYPIIAMSGIRRFFLSTATPQTQVNDIIGIGVNRTIYMTFDPTQGAGGYPTNPDYAFRFDYTGINILTNSTILPSVRFAEVNTNPSNQYSELGLFATGLWNNASFGLSSCIANYTFVNAAVPPTNQSSAVGDPAFTGFLGQQYQIHGMADTVYALISDATMQLNAQFVFLSRGQCPIVNGSPLTNCWSHPGSYFGSLALQTAEGDQLLITAGSYKDGFQVTLNNKPLTGTINLAGLRVTIVDSFRLSVETPLYKMQIENSDMFVNIATIQVNDWAKLKSVVQPHGLLGQTWKVRGKRVIEGTVDDYAEANNALFGSDFLYSKFSKK